MLFEHNPPLPLLLPPRKQCHLSHCPPTIKSHGVPPPHICSLLSYPFVSLSFLFLLFHASSSVRTLTENNQLLIADHQPRFLACSSSFVCIDHLIRGPLGIMLSNIFLLLHIHFLIVPKESTLIYHFSSYVLSPRYGATLGATSGKTQKKAFS
jgi:hypothetical protein